jgi:hypothetical protein
VSPLLPTILFLLATGCAASGTKAATQPAGNDVWELALQWKAAADDPLRNPSFEAARGRAIELANLAQRASRDGLEFPARQLALAADRTRDVLLACRYPTWQVLEPLQRAVDASSGPAFVPWLQAHQTQLRAGRDAGFVASRFEIETGLSYIDALLTDSAATDPLYARPSLRGHRQFLADELLPHASADAGLGRLPSGAECHAALTREALGASWNLTEVRATAERQLQGAPPNCRASTLSWADEAARANREYAPGAWPTQGFQPHLGIATGWPVYLHRYGSKSRPEWVDRHPGLLSALALGTLFEINLHSSPPSVGLGGLGRRRPAARVCSYLFPLSLRASQAVADGARRDVCGLPDLAHPSNHRGP